MPRVDHRVLTVPLVVVGASMLITGILGLVVEQLSDLTPVAPVAIGAIGLVALAIGLVVELVLRPRKTGAPLEVIPIPADPKVKRDRRNVAVVAGAAVVLLLAVVAGGAALTGVVDVGGDDTLDAAATDPAANLTLAPLASDEVSGSLQGAPVPDPIPAPAPVGNPEDTVDFQFDASVRGAFVEFSGDSLALSIQAQVDDAWTEIGTAAGAIDVPEGATGVRAVVSLTGPSAGSAYTLRYATFAGAVPEGFAFEAEAA